MASSSEQGADSLNTEDKNVFSKRKWSTHRKKSLRKNISSTGNKIIRQQSSMRRRISTTMGRETDVLQAAQDGNLNKLETLFTQKRFGGLLKGPNINTRDDSGCTPLHLSSLNGHRDVVVFLLHNDASANVPDNAGSYPLHLAAFNGHHEIAKILITRGPSRAQVNEANMAGDTPLHVASQYGHDEVVKILMTCHADATIRNSRRENPLDLAAQYGRMSTVELFLSIDKTLCYKDPVHKHSPLHLASRNGHLDVVRFLLDAGMPVSATCDMGTAFHCAALYGKVAIAKLLLERGVDIEIENVDGEKVLDLLVKHPSKRAQEIMGLIYGKPANSEEKTRFPATSYSGQQFEVIERTPKKETDRSISRPSGYDVVPPPRPKHNSSDADEDRPYSFITGSTDEQQLSDDEDNYDRVTSETPSVSQYGEKFFTQYVPNSSGPYSLIGEDPVLRYKKSVKQQRTSSQRRSTPQAEDIIGGTYTEIKPTAFISKSQNIPTKPSPINSNKPLFGATPTDDSLYQVPPTTRETGNSREIYGPMSAQRQISETNNARHDSVYNAPMPFKQRSQTLPVNIRSSHDTYGFMQPRNIPSPATHNTPPIVEDTYNNVQLTNSALDGDVYNNVNITNKRQSAPTERVSTEDIYDNVNLTNKGDLHSFPININNRQQTSKEIATNATPTAQDDNDMYYQQPPMMETPTKPSADMYYQEPLCQFKQKPQHGIKQTETKQQQYTMVKSKSMKQKRTATIIKRDIDADTTSITLDGNSADNVQPPAVPQTENSPALETEKPLETRINDKTDVNATIDEVFNNLVKVQEEQQQQESTPVPLPRTKSKSKKQGHTNERNVASGYRMSQIENKQPLDETYEWNKIDDFLTNLEEFAGSNDVDESKTSTIDDSKPIESVSDWLESLNLSLYEPMFLTNGFDEIAFINGSLDDQDLIELGIIPSDHRRKILESSKSLPVIPIIDEEGVPVPATVTEWLQIIKLEGYENRFILNGYESMDRVRVIWELELVTVLDINSIGHRKRMLNSLGRKPLQMKAPISWAKRFADAEAGRVKSPTQPDDSMELAHKLMETAKGLTIDRKSSQKTPTTPTSATDYAASDENKENTPKSQPQQQQQQNEDNSKGWIHSPDVLLCESVTYSAQYLGSHPVQKVKGVESTLDACSKMKVLSQNVHKMPSIVLSISVRGIDYIDSNSKMIINSYTISHISFCAQDPKDTQLFAYITRDELTRKNYCHVFKASSTRQADEVILTLGQCFEIAYQQHLALKELVKPQENQNTNDHHREAPPAPVPYAEMNLRKERLEIDRTERKDHD